MKATKQQQALLRAVQNDDLKQVRALLKKKTRPDFPGKSAKTPLQEAIRNGNLPIVKALVNAGANVNLTNAARDNPLDVAYAKGDNDIIRYLRSQGAREASDNYGYIFNGAGRVAASRKAKKPKASKMPGAKGGSKKPARFYDEDWNDDDWGGTPAPPKPEPEPKFTTEKLKDIFNAEKWVGNTQEMARLWKEVPARLKKKFDFEAAYTKARQETILQKYPKPLSLKPRPAPPRPPSAP
jgi:hypothetical protein